MYCKPYLLSVFRITAILCLLWGGERAVFAAGREDGRYFSFGSTNSLKGVGFCADLGHDPLTFSSLALTADLIDILDGKASAPGLKFTYHYNMIWKSCADGKLDFYAGPGLTGGHVRNIDNYFGFMGGVSFDGGVRYSCSGRPVTLCLELQADISLIFKNKYNPAMSLYRAGFRQSYYPHLKIQYVF